MSIASPALVAAREAQTKIEACLNAGQSFRLEAGAGAGKTWSLVAALKRLLADRENSLLQKGQKIACITYTEVARDEIAQELEEHPAILVSTIHAFCWGFMGQFQQPLRDLVNQIEERREKIEVGGGIGAKKIEYDFGFFGVDSERVTLSHDDVPRLMAKLLSYPKFRRLLTQQFPVIFIDEYQDTDKNFMAAIAEFFFETGEGPLIGLFGDHWQTIYRTDYEQAPFNIEGIDKGSNFRSVPAIVDVLNRLRPELPQGTSDPEASGEARFFHVNGWKGERTATNHSKGDVSPEASQRFRELLLSRLAAEGWEPEKTKILMLTHHALAAEQGYPSIADVFDRSEAFAKKENATIKFLAEQVEPMSRAYQASNFGEMFKVLGSAPAIRSHADKLSWRKDIDGLLQRRQDATIGSVIDHLKLTKRPRLPDRVAKIEDDLAAFAGAPIPEDETALIRHDKLRGLPYKEVIELVKFVDRTTPFATQHSVKGAEFENVLVILGGGWNHYNWPKLFELIGAKTIPAKDQKGYYRARNLLYVSVSRPMKRLAVLATQTMSPTALMSIEYLFGSEHVSELSMG